MYGVNHTGIFLCFFTIVSLPLQPFSQPQRILCVLRPSLCGLPAIHAEKRGKHLPSCCEVTQLGTEQLTHFAKPCALVLLLSSAYDRRSVRATVASLPLYLSCILMPSSRPISARDGGNAAGGSNGDGDAFPAMSPHHVESRLSVGQGGMELSASELSDRPLREVEGLSTSPTHEPFPRVDSGAAEEEGGGVGGGGATQGEPMPAPVPEKKSEVQAPHGWPSARAFPRWYWRRVLGFDQSLDVYGFYPSWDQLIAFVFTALTLMVLGLIEHYGIHPLINHTLSVFLPAFGASCTVVFAVPKAPIAQPRNVVFAHVSAAIIGTALTNAFRSVREQPFGQHCAGAIGVALHLVLMMFTNTMHPPASATVISAATATINAYYKDEGFLFVVTPVLFGSVFTTVFSWLLNNMVPSRSPYPQYW